MHTPAIHIYISNIHSNPQRPNANTRASICNIHFVCACIFVCTWKCSCTFRASGLGGGNVCCVQYVLDESIFTEWLMYCLRAKCKILFKNKTRKSKHFHNKWKFNKRYIFSLFYLYFVAAFFVFFFFLQNTHWNSIGSLMKKHKLWHIFPVFFFKFCITLDIHSFIQLFQLSIDRLVVSRKSR